MFVNAFKYELTPPRRNALLVKRSESVVRKPGIVFFTLAALMELARTGSWRQANEKSAAMGKSFERPMWWLRSLGGRLHITAPKS